MSARTRNLLDRFRTLVLPSVVIIESNTVSFETALRTLNVHQLVEAAELAHVIYNEIKLTIPTQSSNELEHIKGLTYWTRQLLQRSIDEGQRVAKDPLTQAYEALERVVKLVKYKAQGQNVGYVTDGDMDRMRSLPQIVRNFYERADWTIPFY
jgi:hypothetical protein